MNVCKQLRANEETRVYVYVLQSSVCPSVYHVRSTDVEAAA